MKFRFPEVGEHSAILGCTGSGKTTLAAFIVSKSAFDQMPYFILDYKRDKLFNSIQRLKEVGFHEPLTTKPGLYIIRARPDMVDECESWFEKLWEHENAFLYIDEGYLAPDKRWLRNLYAQGRSKNITLTLTSQRPVDVPRSAFTEASHLAVFRLNDRKDKQRVQEFTPEKMLDRHLPDYHSFWYGVKDHKADDAVPYAILSPVPGADEIINRIDDRLSPTIHVT